ncbi:hypothetical protein F2Q70_00033749 [Brassica cretica]|uniref:Uncharacterized protein n=1 Tax=Brassica cretica TaxID=69181 RepID=A0A3N6SM91_BRACR|nr:hypothetical protein F2Q70_00033749 [Brassica cretica]KAF3532538.1 hypothetical protein DY000_02036277 [Brassica cretica]
MAHIKLLRVSALQGNLLEFFCLFRVVISFQGVRGRWHEEGVQRTPPSQIKAMSTIQSGYYRGAVGGMLVIILIGALMKGRGVGASGVGRTTFLLLQHRKATAKGPAKKLATLQKQDGDDFKESVEGD